MENSKAKETFSKFGLSYALLYFVYIVIMIVSFVVYGKIVGVENLNGNASMIINYVIRVLILYPAMYFAIRNLPKFEIKKNKLGVGGFIACVCITYAVMVIFNLIGLILNNVIGNITGLGQVNPMVEAFDVMSPVVQVVIVVILAPICEELLFRKFLIDRIAGYGEVTAMLISGLMFGLYHGNLAQFCYAFGLGAFFAFIYLRTGKIQYTIAFHMFVNGFTTFLTLFFMKGINLSEYMDVYTSGNAELITQYVNEHADVFASMGLVSMVIFLLVFSGIILMIVLRKKFVFEHREGEIPKGKRFATAILNVGMIIYIVYWVYSIVATQLGFNFADAIISKLLV